MPLSPFLNPAPTWTQLEAVASQVILLLQDEVSMQQSRVCVVGGLAVSHYTERSRKVKEINILVEVQDAPSRLKTLKDSLLALPATQFSRSLEFLFYNVGDESQVRIDFCPSEIFPYVPVATQHLRHIPKGKVPYIPAVDLLVFRIWGCGLRMVKERRKVDAEHALQLALRRVENGPVRLTSCQTKHVRAGLQAVADNDAEHGLEWWKSIFIFCNE